MCAIDVKIGRIVVRMSATGARIAAMRSSTEAVGIDSKMSAIAVRIGAIAWKTGVTGRRIGGTAAAERATAGGWFVHPSAATQTLDRERSGGRLRPPRL